MKAIRLLGALLAALLVGLFAVIAGGPVAGAQPVATPHCQVGKPGKGNAKKCGVTVLAATPSPTPTAKPAPKPSDPSDQHRPPNTPSGPRERHIESRIEAQLEAGLGFKVATFVRSMSEMEAVATCKPFPSEKLEKEGSSLFVAFLRGAASEEARSRVIALGSETDSFHFHARELYWWTRANMSASPLFAGSRVEKALGELSTTRNITTVRKLAALRGEEFAEGEFKPGQQGLFSRIRDAFNGR